MAARKKPGDGKRVRAPSIVSPYISIEEAAIYLRISRRALEHFRATGEGPTYRKHGGPVVYHIDDLDHWSARRRYRSPDQKDEG